MRTFNFPKIIFLILLSCNTARKENPSEDPVEDPSKPVAELSYGDIWQLLLANNDAGGLDVETEDYKKDAIRKIVEIIAGECVEEDCGDMVQLQSTSQDKIITVIVKFNLNLPNNPVKEIIRRYDIGSMAKVGVGCSHFCYGGERYGIKREYLAATFK